MCLKFQLIDCIKTVLYYSRFVSTLNGLTTMAVIFTPRKFKHINTNKVLDELTKKNNNNNRFILK